MKAINKKRSWISFKDILVLLVVILLSINLLFSQNGHRNILVSDFDLDYVDGIPNRMLAKIFTEDVIEILINSNCCNVLERRKFPELNVRTVEESSLLNSEIEKNILKKSNINLILFGNIHQDYNLNYQLCMKFISVESAEVIANLCININNEYISDVTKRKLIIEKKLLSTIEKCFINLMPTFPFPPPKSSTNYVFEKEYLSNFENLYEVGNILDQTLKLCGYHERSYYQIPEGFALVTRMEQIELDATPSPIPDRWNAPHKEEYTTFTLKKYFQSLFFAKKGKYRIIVFLVTSIPFSQTETQMKIDDAQRFLKKGYNSLPIDFQSIKFTEDYECTALIYEFDKMEFEEGIQIESSKHLAFEHLKKNNFISIFTKKTK